MDGQLCYEADVEKRLREEEERLNKTRDEVVDKRKAVTEGLVFVLDYNENRMVDVGGMEYSSTKKKEDHILYIGTIGKSLGESNKLHWGTE